MNEEQPMTIMVPPQPELREFPAETIKKKRGRPVGSKNKPKPTDPTQP